MNTYSVLRKYICSFLSYVCGFCLHVCTMCVYCPQKPEKGIRYFGPGGCHVDAGSRPQSTGRAAKALTTKQSPKPLLFLQLKASWEKLNGMLSWFLAGTYD